MNLKTNFNKMVKGNCSGTFIFMGIIIVALVALKAYSKNKGLFPENLTVANNNTVGEHPLQASKTVSPAAGDALTVDLYAHVPKSGGPSSGPILPASCAKKSSFDDPKELLPLAGDNKFSVLQPVNDLTGVNLLQAGHHIGIDTVGQSLRNANQQLRSEPPNPQTNVGPWMNSTMEPDLQRKPLEIGCNC